jgi:cyclophilin family peptidyl-prolyl cis-trans isomerase
MANQQTKRRRKRYQPGSAYAGDVRPRGVFSIFGNVRLFFIIGVAIMLGSLGVGGIIGSDFFGGPSQQNPSGFVKPEGTDEATGEPRPTLEVRQYDAPPAFSLDTSKTYVATIQTELGDIQIELLDDEVPQTVNNFVFLARDGFYDGLIFHQVVPGFDVQAGDPSCQAASADASCRGSGDPGYDLSQEHPGSFERGFVGMANASQFFIALASSDDFDGFTPFGRVTAGLDVAEQVTKGTAIQSIEIRES